jgi:hypothetical protein
VESVGTHDLHDAMALFEAAVHAAKARLAAAEAFGNVLAEAAADVEMMAQAIAIDYTSWPAMLTSDKVAGAVSISGDRR